MAGGAHSVTHSKEQRRRRTFYLVPILILSFLLVLYSTFLTRSGILGDSSVHAFVDLGLSGQLLIYLLFFTIGSLGYCYGATKFTEKRERRRMDSREFWMFIGALVLLISGLQITLSTSYPFSTNFLDLKAYLPIRVKIRSERPHRTLQCYPGTFSLIIVLLIGAGQFLSYHKTSKSQFFKRQILTLIATTLLSISCWVLDMWNPMYVGLALGLLLRCYR
jgi:cytochrome c-type biogenesis protein CcmF